MNYTESYMCLLLQVNDIYVIAMPCENTGITKNRTSFCNWIDGFISLVCSMFLIAPLEPVIRGRKFEQPVIIFQAVKDRFI